MQMLKHASKNGEFLQHADKEDEHHCLSGRKRKIYCAALPQQCKSLSMLTQNIGEYYSRALNLQDTITIVKNHCSVRTPILHSTDIQR